MPPADQGFSALLDDLDCRGLLDETLVVWVGEFGRTPRINKANSGREHWPHCYSAVLAGAGVRGGFVFGASDRWAAYPASDPVSPDDLGATILHALGIEPGTMVKDAVDRPLRINDGSPSCGYLVEAHHSGGARRRSSVAGATRCGGRHDGARNGRSCSSSAMACSNTAFQSRPRRTAAARCRRTSSASTGERASSLGQVGADGHFVPARRPRRRLHLFVRRFEPGRHIRRMVR